MNKILNKIIFFTFLATGVFNNEVFCQGLIDRYTILKKTDGDFQYIKENATSEETKNNYYKKYTYKDSLLISISLHDKYGELIDDVYSNALTIFEYNNGILKFKKLYNKNNQRIEDGFKGYWSIEYFINPQGKIIKEIYRDKFDKPVKYYSNIDFAPPILEYDYLDKTCLRKWIDNENNIRFIDICDFPVMNIKLEMDYKK